MATTVPNPSADRPGAGQSRQTRGLLEFSFTERHPALALALTLLWLIVLGVTTGCALGALAAQLVGFALAELGGPR